MIEMHPNAASMRLLNASMKAADKNTTMSAKKSGRKAAYFICRSLKAGAKPKSMAKKRDVVPNPARTGRGRKASGAKLAIKVLHQRTGGGLGGKPTYIPTNKRSDMRRRIKNLGLAASSFGIAAGAFGKRISGKRTKGAKKHADGKWRTTRRSFRATITSFLSYVEIAFPGIADIAIKKGMTSFIRSFDRDWATALKKGESY